MSRRDSRVPITERQNDTLLEFENFKRKYLLVNKHITKLNSTLSVRVEELNAQVSSLYVENLKLRASEISLASQLKREREKVQQVVEQAENAVTSLMHQLTSIRTSSDTPLKHDAYSPVLKRKPPSSPIQPPREAIRLVKPPADAIHQIRESDEEDDDDDDEDTPTRLVTTRTRPSSSRVPLPKLVPPLPNNLTPSRHTPIPHINLTAGATKRKAVRKDLFPAENEKELERPSSPIFQHMSAMRARMAWNERKDDVGVGLRPDSVQDSGLERRRPKDDHVVRPERVEATNTEQRPKKAIRSGKSKPISKDVDRETETLSVSERDSSESAREKEKRRSGIKDVTNSPRKKPSSEFAVEKPMEGIPLSAMTVPSGARTPVFESSAARSNTPPLLNLLPTPTTDVRPENEGTNGREKRTRKSVNYAEPKLNTKMRKPDPPETDNARPRTSGSTTTRRRKSIPTPSPGSQSDDGGDADVEGFSTKWTEGRRKTVHNTTISGSASLPYSETPSNTRGIWGPEGKRHSMVV